MLLHLFESFSVTRIVLCDVVLRINLLVLQRLSPFNTYFNGTRNVETYLIMMEVAELLAGIWR